MSEHDDDTCPHFVMRTLLESEKQYTEQVRVENSILMKEVVLLMAEVERLRKAGDEMLGDYKETGVIFPPSEAEWNAAKEGRPHE